MFSTTKQAHDVVMTLPRHCDVISTPCACWEKLRKIEIFYLLFPSATESFQKGRKSGVGGASFKIENKSCFP